MKRALFIGRWQPLHPGHQWLFNQKLEQGIPILIAVRDTPVNDSNPFATEDVIANLEKEYSEEVESGMVEYVENTENVTVNVPVVTDVEVGVGVEATRTAPAPSGN